MKSKNLNAIQGTIDNFESSEQFDAVYTREVVEHLYNPLSVFKK